MALCADLSRHLPCRQPASERGRRHQATLHDRCGFPHCLDTILGSIFQLVGVVLSLRTIYSTRPAYTHCALAPSGTRAERPSCTGTERHVDLCLVKLVPTVPLTS